MTNKTDRLGFNAEWYIVFNFSHCYLYFWWTLVNTIMSLPVL